MDGARCAGPRIGASARADRERVPSVVGMLRFFESPSAAERLAAAERVPDAYPPGTELLVIGASRDAADDVCRAAARRAGTAFGLHRFTLAQYASHTGGPRLAARGLALCTPLGAEAVAARTAFEARRRRALTYLEPVVDTPGFARALASTLHDLRHARVAPAALRALAPPGPDLAALLAEYDRQLEDGRIADRAMLLTEAARAVAADPASTLATRPAVLVDVRLGSPVEWALVQALADASPDLFLTVPFGDVATRRLLDAAGAVAVPPPSATPGGTVAVAGTPHREDAAGPAAGRAPSRDREPTLFAASPPPAAGIAPGKAGSAGAGRNPGLSRGRTPTSSAEARPLAAAADPVPAPAAVPPPASSSSLDRLARQLFAESAEVGAADDGAIEFFSAPGEGRECVEVARRILREAARGVPFDEIAVVVRAPESYWGLLEHALHRAGVKAWFSRGTRRPDPAGRAFLAMLACAAERLSARRFAEYLSLGQVPPRQEDGSPPDDPPVWVPPREETLDAGQLSLFDLLVDTIDGPDNAAAAVDDESRATMLPRQRRARSRKPVSSGASGSAATAAAARAATPATRQAAASSPRAGSRTDTAAAPSLPEAADGGRSAESAASGERAGAVKASDIRAAAADASGATRDAASAESAASGERAAASAHDDGESTPRAPRRWESLIVESSVIGGADRWERRLAGLIEELRVRRDEAADEEPESPRVRALERDLAQVEDLRSFALPVIRALAAFPEAASWGDWLDRLDALAPQVLRHPERVLELLAELRPMAAVGPLTLHEVRDVLTPRLATLEREPPKHRYGRVFVCTPAQLRGRAFRTVFITGLAERIFPQKPRQDPLLLDPLRRALDAPLDVEDDRVLGERLLLRLAVGAARERLFLSYPRLDVAQARPRVPSFYALDIVRALTGRVPHYELFERDTAAQSGAWLAWPAPPDPADAIDTFEHDLAVLGPLLAPGHDRAAVRGRAHYLLEEQAAAPANARLRRSLVARWTRWKRGWSAYDGLLKVGDETRAALAAQRPTRRPYSVSALQRFAACPYQFLLGSIYRLEAFDPPESLERLDPLTKGALFHEIQRDFFRALQASGLIPLTVARHRAAADVLDRTVASVAARYYDRLAPAVDRVWRDEVEALRGDLQTWLSRLVVREDGWEPRHFELSFGMRLDGEHDAASVPDPVTIGGRFLLRGAIDLIEEQPATGLLRVTDHKTGKNRTTPYQVVGGGGALQPVIYGMVVEEVFKRPVAHARLDFATTAGGFTEHTVSLRDEAKRAGVEVLEIIDRAVESGRLPAAPKDFACTYCDFFTVCGPMEEARVKQKSKDPDIVGDLLALRGLK